MALGYGGSGALKTQLVQRVANIRGAGNLGQGGRDGIRDGRGGLVWSVNQSVVDPRATASNLGVPTEVVRAAEVIFEGLGPVAAQLWPERFLNAIVTGGNTVNTWAAFSQWLLGTQLATADPPDAPCATLAALFGRWITGGVSLPTQVEWDAARVLAQGDLAAVILRRKQAARTALALWLPASQTSSSPVTPRCVAVALGEAAQAAVSGAVAWANMSDQLVTVLQAAT